MVRKLLDAGPKKMLLLTSCKFIYLFIYLFLLLFFGGGGGKATFL